MELYNSHRSFVGNLWIVAIGEYPFDHREHMIAMTGRLFFKIIWALFCVCPMYAAQMVFIGNVTSFGSFAFMQGDTLMLIIDLYRRTCIMDLGGLADIPIRHAVITLVR